MKVWPAGLTTQFLLLLLGALLAVNIMAAVFLAREGTFFDRAVRIEGDMARLVSMVTALENVDAQTAETILSRNNTRFSRFSLTDQGVQPRQTRPWPTVDAALNQALAGRRVHVFDGGDDTGRDAKVLLMLSVQLAEGASRGKWLTAVIYPLPPIRAWSWKIGFFAPLFASLGATLLVGGIFVRQMTGPLRGLAEAAHAAGRGDRSARAPERGAMELRDAAIAFNDMQRRIAAFDAERLRLVAAIGHDLRTPITSLRIRAEMLDPGADRQDFIRILDDMQVMTGELLAYSRGAASGEEPVQTDLAALIARLCDERGLPAPTLAPAWLRLRPVALSRALGNMIDNALRYAGSVRIGLETTEQGVEILIDDDGPGIPEGQLCSITEPFVRGDDSRSVEGGGLGLGLSIAKEIVIANGGMLTLNNRPGGGLRVLIRFAPCPQA